MSSSPCDCKLVSKDFRGCLDRIKAFQDVSRELGLDIPPDFDVKKAFDDLMKKSLTYSNKRIVGAEIFKQLTNINAKFWAKVKTLVIKELRLNHTREFTFQSICKSVGFDPMPIETVKEWFELHHQTRLRPLPTITEDYLKLIQMIDAKFFRLNNAIFKNFHFNINGMFASNLRYGGRCVIKQDSQVDLMLVDLLHGMSR
jgi:hypothetical protein